MTMNLNVEVLFNIDFDGIILQFYVNRINITPAKLTKTGIL